MAHDVSFTSFFPAESMTSCGGLAFTPVDAADGDEEGSGRGWFFVSRRLDCFTSAAARLRLLNPPSSACADSQPCPDWDNP